MDEIRWKDRFTGEREGGKEGGGRAKGVAREYDKPVHVARCTCSSVVVDKTGNSTSAGNGEDINV